MDIKRAKQEIETTVRAYLAKDDVGNYRIPALRQRPLLLMGPPGVGKTQIVEQAARGCGIALVAYTHYPSHPPKRRLVCLLSVSATSTERPAA